jgi:hypothetical protein
VIQSIKCGFVIDNRSNLKYWKRLSITFLSNIASLNFIINVINVTGQLLYSRYLYELQLNFPCFMLQCNEDLMHDYAAKCWLTMLFSLKKKKKKRTLLNAKSRAYSRVLHDMNVNVETSSGVGTQNLSRIYSFGHSFGSADVGIQAVVTELPPPAAVATTEDNSNGLRLRVWPHLVKGLTHEDLNFTIRFVDPSCDPDDGCSIHHNDKVRVARCTQT